MNLSFSIAIVFESTGCSYFVKRKNKKILLYLAKKNTFKNKFVGFYVYF
ncbi:hypothetical protein M472_13080 [Sphingobacterium paucimobilis HER1398]|uniref:Uncharacterized protein n=1 Tax=Sphingobacterium paucimobilis HER1398 TaxID=1346330 RepID=U2HW06_9SPHI|nr:hypothetical protein M472_13080 [Sphingobacterium paucimobilis HER1398]